MDMRGFRSLRSAVPVVVAVAALSVGCNLAKESAPGLSGPSTLGQSLTLAASTDRIQYDGAAQAVVTATVRKATGEPWPGVPLRWSALLTQTVNGSVSAFATTPVEPVPQYSTTDASGRASTLITAPLAPEVYPAGVVALQITAMPLNDDASQLAPGVDAKKRTVVVELVPVTGGTPVSPNRLPEPEFTISPPSASVNQLVTFDGSLTRDDGQVCGDRCTYVWDFGTSYPNKRGKVVTMTFTAAFTDLAVRLFVTDDRGGSNFITHTLRINGPTAPVAAFTVTPASPKVGVGARFDGSTSTVGSGATILTYGWDFGDGSSPTEGRQVTHTYTTAVDPITLSNSYLVSLTVTDDLGRKSKTTTLVTVVP